VGVDTLPGGRRTAVEQRRDASPTRREALLQLLETTPSADFEAVVYYEDADVTIAYGCKDGQCYGREVPEAVSAKQRILISQHVPIR